MASDFHSKHASLPEASLTLRVRPERKLLRKAGSAHALDFSIQVSAAPASAEKGNTRPALRLALVLDRSGSMQGEKLEIAKQAAQTVVDQLTERDSVSVTAFDNEIMVVQALAQVTPALKKQVRTSIQRIEARASTALHEGWLTGCNSLVNDSAPSGQGALARCFLLTDGIANVGETDPERIASEAAGVREHTHISTSTFGMGEDYNELLLGPMAVAGGGQFHHLRSPHEILSTFVGELGELFSVAMRQVRLEVEVESGLKLDLLSAYWRDEARNTIAVGDLQYGEEQHVVVRIQFPAQWNAERRTVRARLLWSDSTGEQQGAWQEIHFNYADEQEYEEEVPDAEVVQIVGLQEADRARREAIALNKQGNLEGARNAVQRAVAYVAPAASASPALQAEIDALQDLSAQVSNAPMAPAMAKEYYYQQQRRSRNKADYRNAPSPPEKKE